jgi:hypothetical protein
MHQCLPEAPAIRLAHAVTHRVVLGALLHAPPDLAKGALHGGPRGGHTIPAGDFSVNLAHRGKGVEECIGRIEKNCIVLTHGLCCVLRQAVSVTVLPLLQQPEYTKNLWHAAIPCLYRFLS